MSTRMHRFTAGAVAYRLRVELRTRWNAWLALACMIGLTSGIALAAAAGARRTDSAYPRFLESADQADVLVAANSPEGRGNDPDNPVLAEIARLPEVARAARFAQLATAIAPTFEEAQQIANEGLGSLTLLDGSGYEVSRPKLLAGRMPDPRRADEALINPRLAAQNHLRVRSRFRVWVVDSDAYDASILGGTPYEGPVDHLTVTVTGIGQFARDLAPTTTNDESPVSYLTPAFVARFPHSIVNLLSEVSLAHGASVEQFRADVFRVAAAHGIAPSGVYFTAERDRTTSVARAIRPQVLALALLALLTGFAALLVVGQALSRQAFVDATDSATLGAIGMTRRQRFALALARVALVSTAGGIIAALLATALSPLFPIGLARDAEPSPGLRLDVLVLGLGFLAVVVAFMLRAVVTARRGASRAPGQSEIPDMTQTRPSGVAAAVGRAARRPAPVIGMRMAFEPGRGRTAVPVRSALVTTALAVTAVTAVVLFAGNLDQLVTTPARYGWDWTGSVGFGFDPIPASVNEALVGNADLTGVAGGNYLDLTIDGRTVTAVTFDQLKGHVGPVILEGRARRADNELALGTRTMRDAGLAVGDRVRVWVEERPAIMRVVGRAVFPRLGAGSFTPTDIGDGAALTNVAATRLGADTASPDDPGARYSVFFVRATPGTTIADLARSIGHDPVLQKECGDGCISFDQRPGDIVAYGRVRGTSVALVALLALMALAALAHSLVTSVQRRRRDLAILKTLGLTAGEISAAVRWQGLALSVSALVVGLPLGIVAGRGAWMVFAHYLGVADDVSVPAAAIGLAVPATLVLTVLVAAMPARLARATRPAIVLRRA